MAVGVPFKLKTSDSDFQDFSSTEENYLAFEVGRQYAIYDSSKGGSLGFDSSGGRIVGTLTDTSYDSSEGSHVNVTLTITSTNIFQNMTTADSVDASLHRIPVYQNDSDGQFVIREFNDSDRNTLVDRLNSRIFTSDYPGSYKLGSSAPSADYAVALSNVMTDTRSDSNGGASPSIQYNIYQRKTMTSPTQTLPFALKRADGDSGTYQGLQLMTDSQIGHSLAEIGRNRITGGDSNGDYQIGSYLIRSSIDGAPTAPGTWVSKGTATDTRLTETETNYTSASTNTYTGEFLGNFVGEFTNNFTNTFTGNFENDFTRNSTNIFTQNRQSNYTVGFVGDYTRVSTNNFTTDFTRTSTRTSTQDFTRTRIENFTGDFIGNYIGTQTFTSATQYNFGSSPRYYYIHNDFGSGAGDESAFWDDVSYSGLTYGSGGFQGSFTTGGKTYTAEAFQFNEFDGLTGTSTDYYSVSRSSSGTADYTRNRTSTFTGNFLGNFIGNFAGNFAGNFVGDFTGDFLGNFQNFSQATFVGNFLGDFQNTFTGDFTGNFTGDFTGNYTGDFTGNFLGNFTGDYIGTQTFTTPEQYDYPSNYWFRYQSIAGGAAANLSAQFNGVFKDYQNNPVASDSTEATNREFTHTDGFTYTAGTYQFTSFGAGASDNYYGVIRSSSSSANFTRISTRDSTVNSTQDFTRNSTQDFTRNSTAGRVSNFTRISTANFTGGEVTSTQTFVGDYTGDFTGNFTGLTTTDFTGDFTGNFERDSTAERASTFTGDFLGDYTGLLLGGTSTNFETFTMYVKTA